MFELCYNNNNSSSISKKSFCILKLTINVCFVFGKKEFVCKD